jgi:CheY-like chemotaxis protein
MARVLIVDDEQDIRDTIRFILEDAGYEVIEADDGAAALGALRASGTPLVVLLDLLLPRVSGIDVMKAVLDDPALSRRSAFLLMTADSANLKQQADPLLAQMSAQVISKPFDVDVLLAMVDQAAHSLP